MAKYSWRFDLRLNPNLTQNPQTFFEELQKEFPDIPLNLNFQNEYFPIVWTETPNSGIGFYLNQKGILPSHSPIFVETRN